jgi:hypothetical protein
MYVCSHDIHFYNDDGRSDGSFFIVYFYDDIWNAKHVIIAPLPFHHAIAYWRERRAYRQIVSREEYNEFLNATHSQYTLHILNTIVFDVKS